MAKGDSLDMVARLKSVLPASWFLNDEFVLTTILSGLSSPLSWIYQLYSYTLQQLRIRTATGVWLDRISYDYLGNKLPRRFMVNGQTQAVTTFENDDSYRQRILKEIMRERQTRSAIQQALVDLTGQQPAIYEPWNPDDCGAYGIGNLGYGMGGCYGSLLLNNQIFVTAVRTTGSGVPNVGGYGLGAIGYGEAGEYITESQITGLVTDADIYATVSHTIAAGMTAWTAITDKLPSTPPTPITSDNTKITADTGIVTTDVP